MFMHLTYSVIDERNIHRITSDLEKNSPRIQASSAAVYPQLFGKSVHQQI